jgi:lipoprotein NlpD
VSRASLWSSFLALIIAAILAACSSGPSRVPETYVVKRGDTLYSIAWRHGLDYREVARWNRIGRDYVIHPGQRLVLKPSHGVARSAATPTRPQSARQPSRPTPAAPTGPPVQWQWPVEGGTATLTTRPNGGYGLTISGTLGEDVKAAGDGKVVYTGSGLLGYGQLIIVKHNETYLSAYGHTQNVLAKEGDAVRAGQRIATMGSGPQGTPMLYFEIRIQGSPGNPLTLLPQRR